MSSHKIYIGNAINILPSIESDKVHLILTGPPIYSRYRADIQDELGECPDELGGRPSVDEFSNQLKDIFIECNRTLIPGGKFIVQTGQIYTLSGMINLATLFHSVLSDMGLYFNGEIYYYNKRQHQRRVRLGSYPYPGSIPICNLTEKMLVFTKLGKRHIDKESRLSSIVTKEQFKEFTQPVWEFNERVEHFRAPLELFERIIRFYSYEGDTVLDPFVGSGTTTLASMNLQRDSIGVEINLNVIPRMQKRLGLHWSSVEVVHANIS